MFGRVAIERIFDNPFQTRTVYTEIEELGASILKMRAARTETSGLIQVPPARILVAVEHFTKRPKRFDLGQAKFCTLNADWYGGVDSCLEQEPLAFVQLAAGHRRFRAFAHLAQSEAEYGTFPVDVLMLDNQQMADLAWEENAKRKDLTAIEEAEALAHAIETFNLTQAQIKAAQGRICQALEGRELRAWRKLVDSTAGYGKGDKLATVEECLERIAASILSSQLHELTWGSWDSPERLQSFEGKLTSRLAELGISQEIGKEIVE